MDQRLRNHAVLLFHEKYRKDPDTEGLKIDYYRAKDVFLYSTSQEAIDAFKACQNVLTGMLKYYFGSLFACIAIEAFVLFKLSSALLTFAYVALATVGLWGLILLAVGIFCFMQNRKIKKNPVILIPNEEDDD